MNPPAFDPNSYGFRNGVDNSASQTVAIASNAMKRVYFKMTLGLLVTAFVSMFCAGSQAYWQLLGTHSWSIWALFIVEIILVIAISSAINKMSSPLASLLFYIFAAVNGAALAPIFVVYTGTSIAKTFFITAGTFGAMSIYGYFTDKDLTRWGSMLFMALIGLILVSIVNIFLHSSTLEWIISGAGVLIFVGLTAWDTQTIKRMAEQTPASEVGRLATIGALNLYLDFINLFLYLLRFFGNSRD